MNPKMKQATYLFGEVISGNIILENVRDDLCSLVHAQNETVFLYGRRGMSVVLLADALLAKSRE